MELTEARRDGGTPHDAQSRRGRGQDALDGGHADELVAGVAVEADDVAEVVAEVQWEAVVGDARVHAATKVHWDADRTRM